MKRWIWGVLAALAISSEVQAQVGTFKRLIDLVDARTIASNGAGTPATLTLTPIASYITLTCNDPDTCTITMGETGVVDGQHLAIVNVGTNACTFTTSAGVLQLSSSASLAQWGVLYLEYVTDRWVEVSRNGGGGGTVTTTGSPASGNLAKFSGAATITNADLTGDVTTTGTVATTIANDAVSNAKLRNSGALSVIGRSANSTGDPADISASAASGQVLRESGSVLGFGTIATAGIADAAVTYAKMQDVSAASRILGRGSASGAGDVEELTLGSGLTLSGTTLAATGAGGGGAATNDHFVTTQGEVDLSNEFNLGSLSTGMLKHTVSGSISTPATAVDGTDYLSPATGMTKLAQIVTSGSQATVDFTSISGAYTTLKVLGVSRDTASGTSDSAVMLKVNNDGTAGNYTATSRVGSANAVVFVTTVAATSAGVEVAFHPNDGNTAGMAGSFEITLNGYANTTWRKMIIGLSADQTGSLNGVIESKMAVWNSTSAITRLTFSCGTAFKDGSVFTLYGIP